MFDSYFKTLEKQLLKKYRTVAQKTVKKKTVKKKVAKKVLKTKYYEELVTALDAITSPELKIIKNNIVDQSGYVSSSADFIACKNIYTDMESIFSEGIPAELVYAAFHVSPVLNRKNLMDVLIKVANTKKSDEYVEKKDEKVVIPSFIISFNSSYNLKELKESIVDIYSEESVEPQFEFDIMVLLGEGIVIKDWRDRRAFVALETKEDTLKWFFILINEYLDTDKNSELDLRSYVKETRHYNEY